MFPIRRCTNFVARISLVTTLTVLSLIFIFGLKKENLKNDRNSVNEQFFQYEQNHQHQQAQNPTHNGNRREQVPIGDFTGNKKSISINNEFVNSQTLLERRRLLQENDSIISDSTKIGNKQLGIYVHLDLKGAAPKISYFEKLFPLLRKLGAQGICIEYEDMFPFEGIVENVKNKLAYSKNDVEKINRLAKENQLDVMPLLQTYGHLEFVLKLEQFKDLRENLRYPQVISPCLNKTYSVLFSMIDQYLQSHPDMRYFHIGNDEVYYFFANPACHEFRRVTQIQNQYELFARHLSIIVRYIKEKNPKLELFVWHDILQNLNTQMLQQYNLLSLVTPVLWSYREDMSVEGFVVSSTSTMFGQFKSLWGSTAFKGASHEVATISDVRHYYENQVSWIQQLRSFIPNRWSNFQGMIVTGWSRFDHFLSLCELLPYSIPSLAFALNAWKEPFLSQGKTDLHSNNALQKHVQEELGCASAIHLTIQDHSSKPNPKCQFPGAPIYESLISLPLILVEVSQAESFVDKFVTDLHMKYNYIHVKRGEECLEKLNPAVARMNTFIDSFKIAMNEVFPPQVAIEWLETYFMKKYRSVVERQRFIQRSIQEQTHWLPRPIPDTDQLKLDKK